METRYAVTGKAEDGERVNVFNDNRTYRTKSYANGIAELMWSYFEHEADLQVDEVQVESELDKHKRALEVALWAMDSLSRGLLIFPVSAGEDIKKEIEEILK